MHQNLWDAYYATVVPNAAGYPMVLASNSSVIAAAVSAGSSNVPLALTYQAPAGNAFLPEPQWPAVVFTLANGAADTSITTQVTGFNPQVTYAIPGNTYPGTFQLLNIAVTIDKNATPGVRGVVIVPAGQAFSSAITPWPAAPPVVRTGPSNPCVRRGRRERSAFPPPPPPPPPRCPL